MTDQRTPRDPAGRGSAPAGRYRLEWKRSAIDDLKRLTKRVREQVNALIQDLPINPHPPGSAPLGHGFKGLMRLESGDYRIVYAIDRQRLVILIVLVGNRKQIYDRLRRMLYGK